MRGNSTNTGCRKSRDKSFVFSCNCVKTKIIFTREERHFMQKNSVENNNKKILPSRNLFTFPNSEPPNYHFIMYLYEIEMLAYFFSVPTSIILKTILT